MKDYRYQKTEKRILEACTKLAKKKDIYSLNVTEIAKEANINRITFYSHYENVDALIEHIEDMYNEQGFSEMSPFSDLIYAPEKFLERCMQIYQSNIAEIFFKSSRKESFLQKSIRTIINKTLEECAPTDGELEKKIIFIEHGIYGIFNEYDIDDAIIEKLAAYIKAVLKS